MDFHILETEQEYFNFKRELDLKFGMVKPKLINEPEVFPVLIAYCFVNDMNGASINLKHISLKKLKKTLNEINT